MAKPVWHKVIVYDANGMSVASDTFIRGRPTERAKILLREHAAPGYEAVIYAGSYSGDWAPASVISRMERL
jgi:hypothetical protein